jgi:hypothetical protein
MPSPYRSRTCASSSGRDRRCFPRRLPRPPCAVTTMAPWWLAAFRWTSQDDDATVAHPRTVSHTDHGHRCHLRRSSRPRPAHAGSVFATQKTLDLSASVHVFVSQISHPRLRLNVKTCGNSARRVVRNSTDDSARPHSHKSEKRQTERTRPHTKSAKCFALLRVNNNTHSQRSVHAHARNERYSRTSCSPAMPRCRHVCCHQAGKASTHMKRRGAVAALCRGARVRSTFAAVAA